MEDELKRDSQSRNWLFTINNPEQTEIELIRYFKSLSHVKYFCFGREKGDKCGTEHYQGYIDFIQPKAFSTMKKIFSEPNVKPNAHIEQKSRFSKKSDCRDYIFKIGAHVDKAHTRIGDVYEYGEFVEERKRSDIDQIREAILEHGMTPHDVVLHIPSSATKTNYVDRLYFEKMSLTHGVYNRDNIEVVYIFGPSRTGKTLSIDKLHEREEFFRVTNYKHPFDSYRYQPVLVLDEYDSQLDITYLNNLLDRYPCELVCRYFPKWAAWNKVYIISNLPFEKLYPFENSEKRDALRQRIKEIREFKHFAAPVATQSGMELIPITGDDLPF